MASGAEASAVWWVRPAEMGLLGRGQALYGSAEAARLLLSRACVPRFKSRPGADGGVCLGE